MKRLTASERGIRTRRQGAGFAFESPALYLWDEQLSEVMRDALEFVGETSRPRRTRSRSRIDAVRGVNQEDPPGGPW